MKKLFKFGCLGIIGLIILGIVVASLGGGDSTSPNEENQTEGNNQTQENEESQDGESSPSEESSTSNDGNISAEEFEQISSGMTYEEVVEIIGSEGSVQSETGEEGSQFHTVIYSWDGEAGWGSNALLTFQNEELQSKAQAGVGGGNSSEVTITMDEFNQLENGMSTEEVFEIVGGEGELTSETGEQGTQYYTVTYTYYGETGVGANATLMFQGGELSSKSQFGLE